MICKSCGKKAGRHCLICGWWLCWTCAPRHAEECNEVVLTGQVETPNEASK